MHTPRTAPPRILSLAFPAALTTALLAVLVLAQGAAAQDGECTSEDPCPLVITVDENGFVDPQEWTLTMGDWFVLEVVNADSNETHHSVVLQPPGFIVDVPPFEEARSDPFALGEPGDYVLRDDPTGDEVPITVTELDAAVIEDMEDDATAAPTGGQDTNDEGEGASGPAAFFIVLVLAAVGIVGRAAGRR